MAITRVPALGLASVGGFWLQEDDSGKRGVAVWKREARTEGGVAAGWPHGWAVLDSP